PICLVEFAEFRELAAAARKAGWLILVGFPERDMIVGVAPAVARGEGSPREQPIGRRVVEGRLGERLVGLCHLPLMAAVPTLPADAHRQGGRRCDLVAAAQVSVLAEIAVAPGRERGARDAVLIVD